MENKALAAVISFILPGLGEYLLGRGNPWLIIFIVVLIVEFLLAFYVPYAWVISFILGLFFAADTYLEWINI